MSRIFYSKKTPSMPKAQRGDVVVAKKNSEPPFEEPTPAPSPHPVQSAGH